MKRLWIDGSKGVEVIKYVKADEYLIIMCHYNLIVGNGKEGRGRY